MTKASKKVSESALLRRINRKLKGGFEQIKKCRENSQWINELGAYYRVDLRNNSVVGRHVNLKKLAEEEGVIKKSEQLVW